VYTVANFKIAITVISIFPVLYNFSKPEITYNENNVKLHFTHCCNFPQVKFDTMQKIPKKNYQ